MKTIQQSKKQRSALKIELSLLIVVLLVSFLISVAANKTRIKNHESQSISTIISHQDPDESVSGEVETIPMEKWMFEELFPESEGVEIEDWMTNPDYFEEVISIEPWMLDPDYLK